MRLTTRYEYEPETQGEVDMVLVQWGGRGRFEPREDREVGTRWLESVRPHERDGVSSTVVVVWLGEGLS